MDMTSSAQLAPPLQTKASRLDVMNFLNEISSEYPHAISFASGRPAEEFFRFEQWLARVPAFVAHFARQRGIGADQAYRLLAQYGRTNGVIDDLIAGQLALDEGVACRPDQVIVTGGCQEALDLVVTAVCRDPDDVVLVRSPCYIGITGVADLNGIALASFTCADGAVVAALRAKVARIESEGRRPRMLYLVPDFDNPTGAVLSRVEREQIIAYCAAKRIVVVEDNPYGMFRYEGERVQTMYSLDGFGCVVYLGTYSKTICPALRVGCAVLPSTLFGDAEAARALGAQLSQAKSFVSVNTSQLTQAVVGALLLDQLGSLQALVAPARERYRRNRDLMIAHLEQEFPGPDSAVSWNCPEGGFFLILDLPFAFGREEAQQCANDYQVLAMPLSFFALDERQNKRLRLAFSNIAPEAIAAGIAQLARFVRARIAQGG